MTSIREPDPLLAMTCEFLNTALPAPLERVGTQKLLWMDRFVLKSTLNVAKIRRDRHAPPEELFDPELEQKLLRLLHVMVRNQYMFVGDVPINKLMPIATGVKPRRKRR